MWRVNVDGLSACIEGMSEQLKGAEPLTRIIEHRSLSPRERVWRACLVSCVLL